MEIYILVIEDRHCDTQCRAYSSFSLAKAACDRYLADEDNVEELNGNDDGNCVFMASYGCEGDSVMIVKERLKSE